MLRCRWILSDYGPFTWIKDMIYKKNTLYKTRQKWVGMEKFKFDHYLNFILESRHVFNKRYLLILGYLDIEPFTALQTISIKYQLISINIYFLIDPDLPTPNQYLNIQ
jgi:hypothetical protein